ncbi:MAG: hypothetical protein INQ03_00545 [Candidatus Heimdallarchaeota archaeon]|nr:hypothetical protein [Candidatus Heimdallarchaeota archaeon]
MENNSRFLYPFLTGSGALLAITISKIVELTSGSKEHPIAWVGSAFVLLTVIIIKYYSIDEQKFILVIKESNPTEYQLQPTRFLNGMILAMLIGLIATITIQSNFILGMLVYLMMQVALIYAFSGILVINPIKVLRHPALKKIALISMVFWVITVILVFTLFVYGDSSSLIVVPYVFFLGMMAHFTWYGLSYNRTRAFTYLTIIASAVFVFSDSLIGNAVFSNNPLDDWIFYLIDLTYILNIYLMSQSILYLRDNNGRNLFRD